MLISLEFSSYGWICGFHFSILIFSGLWNLLASSLEWVSFGLFITTTTTCQEECGLSREGWQRWDNAWTVVTLQKIASDARRVFTPYIKEVKIKNINILKISSLNTRKIFASAAHFFIIQSILSVSEECSDIAILGFTLKKNEICYSQVLLF